MVTEADLYSLEQQIILLKLRVASLEQKIEHMADVGDTVEVGCHIYGNMHEKKKYVIERIVKGKMAKSEVEK